MSKIFLSPVHKNALGEDTFWTWFDREVSNSEWYKFQNLADPKDALLRYSTFGTIGPGCECQTIALCWELLPEMRVKLNNSSWDRVINRTYQCAETAKHRVVATHLSVPYYKHCGPVDVLPIGVDTDLFKPMSNKEELKEKYNIPQDKKIGFWMGTTHQMKGYTNLKKYASENPDIHWIVVWKNRSQRRSLHGASEYCHIKQHVISELMNCSDFYLVCGLLSPYFMIEYEAMACNLPMLNISSLEKDFDPGSNPRDKIFEIGWDRPTTLKLWKEYLGNRGVDLQ